MILRAFGAQGSDPASLGSEAILGRVPVIRGRGLFVSPVFVMVMLPLSARRRLLDKNGIEDF